MIENVTVCDILYCPDNCICTLGNKRLWTSCSDQNETFAEITFPEDVTTLYMADVLLDAINRFAFKGIDDRCEVLYINNNRLVDLQPGVFDGLPNLQLLLLHRNQLSKLRLGIFNGLSNLTFIDLRYNHLNNLQPDIFKKLTSLELLYLDNNKITALRSGVFWGLANIIWMDVDDNEIIMIDHDVFHGLDNLVELDLDRNMISELHPEVFNGLKNLEQLELDGNRLTSIPRCLFSGLREMEEMSLSYNMLEEIDKSVLAGLDNLAELYLSYNSMIDLHPALFTQTQVIEVLYVDHNPLSDLHIDVFKNLTHLKFLSLVGTNLSYLPTLLFRNLHSLKFLNISGNHLSTISPQVLQPLTQIVALDLTLNPLNRIKKDSFERLSKGVVIYVDEYATCCFIETANCSFKAGHSSFITCDRLLPYFILQIVVWIVSIGTIIGNIYVLFTRYKQKNDRAYVQMLLITNLSLSDLLMGVYLLILLSVDLYYKDFFPSYSEFWRQSTLCRVSGALSLLSSEASVFFITLISIDRYMCLSSTTRLSKNKAKVAVALLWFAALLITIVSVFFSMFFPTFYDTSEICVGLPISRVYSHNIVSKNVSFYEFTAEQDLDVMHVVEAVITGSQPSYYFSIAIFTGLNLICFVIVAFCYVSIFIIANRASRAAGVTNREREIRRAFKMAAIVFTDFCVWMTVIVLSILVQSKHVTVKPEAYVWIATFALPINSCLNPFLYTLSTMISNRLQSKVVPSTTVTGVNTRSDLNTVSQHQNEHLNGQ